VTAPRPRPRLPAATLAAFGLVNLPLSMLLSPTAAVLPDFYLAHTTVTAGALAAVILAARVFDALTDPLIGVLSDRSGRRTPWLAAGALVVALGAPFLYGPPPDAGAAWLLGWYLVVTLGWTLVEIPHSAMAAELSSDYHERSRIALWRQFLGFAGGILFMAAPLLAASRPGAFAPDVMRTIGVFVAVALPLAVALLWATVAEPPRRAASRSVRFADLRDSLRDAPLLRYFLATQLAFGLATGAVASTFVIYASRRLGLAEHVPQIAVPMTLAMALGMPVWLRVLERVDKHRAWAAAAIGMIGTLATVLLLPTGRAALVPMAGIMTAFGFLLGLSSIALPSMLADVADYDAWRNRRDRTAVLFAFQSLVTKLNQGVGGAAALGIAAAFGFDAARPVEGTAALGLDLAFVALPIALLLPTAVLAWRYPFGRRAQRTVANRLARRARAASVRATATARGHG
jgi:Na+/melibiose symporter-like transporter